MILGLSLTFEIFKYYFFQPSKGIASSDLMGFPNFYDIIKKAVEWILAISYCRGELSFTMRLLILSWLHLLSLIARNKQRVLTCALVSCTETKMIYGGMLEELQHSNSTYRLHFQLSLLFLPRILRTGMK